MFLEFQLKPPIIKVGAGINAFVSDENSPVLDDRDENGRGDSKDTNKEKENIASHQNQLPAHVHRSVAEDVCPKDVKKAGAEKGNDYRGNKQLSTTFQHQQSNSKEVGVGLSTWGFEHVRDEAS